MSVKQVLEFVKNEFVYGGHLLSLGAASIVFTSAMMLGINITWDFLVISYLVIYIAYSYNRLVELKDDSVTNSSRTEHIKKYIKILPFAICGSILIILLLLMSSGKFYNVSFCLFLILGSLLYTEYFKDFTKKIVGFKSLYVSFFWALLAPLLASYYNFPLWLPVFLVFSFIFLRLLVNTIFFDIKDIESDGASGLKTVAIYLGKTKTLTLVHLINLLSFIPIVYGVYANLLPLSALALLIFYFYTVFYVMLSEKKSVDILKVSYIMVDGEYVFWAVAVVLFNVLILGRW